MKNTFNNLKDLINYFQDENFCRQYLAEKRWGNTPACPYCGNCGKIYTIENGKRYKCKECQKKFSVTVGTIFEDSKLPLSTWFQAMYLISTSKKGLSSLQLSSQLGITQKSAWHVLHRVREMLKEKDLAPLENVVEADETYIGGKDSNRHKSKRKGSRGTQDKAVVLGIVERAGKVIAKHIPDNRKETMQPIVHQYVKPNTTVCTDEWYAYNELPERYNHVTVNHGAKIYVDGDTHTNTIEGFWGILKRGIYGIYHSVSEKHLDRYLNEFTGRYNTKDESNTERFDAILSRSEGNLSYNKLTQKTNA